MPSISLDLKILTPEKSLKRSDDGEIDSDGLTNNAFEDDKLEAAQSVEELSLHQRKNGNNTGETKFEEDIQYKKTESSQQLVNKSSPHSPLETVYNNVNGDNQNTEKNYYSQNIVTSTNLSAPCATLDSDDCGSEVSTKGSSVKEADENFVITSKIGQISGSSTMPAGMSPDEQKPIMELKEKNTSKIVGKCDMNLPDVKQEEIGDVGKWNRMKSGIHSFGRPFGYKHNILPPDPTKIDRFKYAWSCPPHGKIGRFMTLIFLFLLLWGTLVYVTYEMALPGGTIFSLLVLVVTAQLGGNLVAKIHLPPLLGMLLVGIIFRSAPYVDIIGDGIEREWSSSLRSMALVVILIRAGLGLDPEALRKLSFVVLRLAAMPCLVETFTVSVVSHFLLGFPWIWGLLLGFILAAVSPAVVVPCLLNLADQGYGVEKGIPTLVIAAASIDDVLAISGFGICLGILFSEGSVLWQGLKGPIEFGMGIGYGILVGIILWALPNKREENANIYRFIMLFLAGLLAIFGSKGIDFGGAGALGCLCVAFVAGYGWRKQGRLENKMQVNELFNVLWLFFQPLLFGLIGTEIRVGDLHASTVGWGVVTLIIGLTFRVIVSFFAVMGGGLTLKERFFVALAWLPKATVQAAIGSTALDFARDLATKGQDMTDEILLGTKVLTIAVLVILITAPIGAVAIMLSAPKLLKRKVQGEKDDALES